MTIDGRAIAEEVYAALAPRFEGLSVPARLGIVVVGKNPVVDSFVGIKTRAAERLGVVMVRRDIQESASTKEAIQEVENLARECSAVIVQLPLPKHMDTNEVLAAIPPEKDVDAIHPRVPEDERLVHAPVALAVEEILMRKESERSLSARDALWANRPRHFLRGAARMCRCLLLKKVRSRT
jgi:5,10-methylene-tetrahydrofolate dehydrogenase/methenyl tetrahydrofolate cyclohydrolase